MKSAIYVRVSTSHQIDKDSLPLQKEDLINYSKYVLGIDDYEIFEDAGFSGKNTDRPAFQKMYKKISKGEFSHLLVWKIDRISRNLLDFCAMYDDLKKYNCTFISKNEQFDTSSAMGEAMLKIILVFAELERKLTGERVKAVMLDRATKGLWNGAPIPLGYVWDEISKFPVIDDIESTTISFIFEKYKEFKSTSILKKIMNTEGIKTKRDGTWTTKTISDIIRNPFYKGTYRYNYRTHPHGKLKDENEWIVLENNHPSIIDSSLWQECNEIMDVNAQRNNAQFRNNTKIHVFAGLVECGECHNNYTAKQDKARSDGYRPSLYVCNGRYNHLGCSQKTISDDIIGTFIFSYIRNLIKISNMLDNKLTLAQFENYLLEDACFKDVKFIDGINDIYQGISFGNNYSFSSSSAKDKGNVTDFEVERLLKEQSKYERALGRLDDLYLFDDASMSEKDYILKKNKLNENLLQIQKDLSKRPSGTKSNFDLSFITDVKLFELYNVLKEELKYKDILNRIGRKKLKEFTNAIITKVIVKNKAVLSIEFKNGLVSEFIYTS